MRRRSGAAPPRLTASTYHPTYHPTLPPHRPSLHLAPFYLHFHPTYHPTYLAPSCPPAGVHLGDAREDLSIRDRLV